MLQTYQYMLLGVCGTRTEPSLQFLNIQEREMNDSADALCGCYLLTLWHTRYAAESSKGMSDDQCAGKVQPECSVCCRCLQSFTRKVLGACTTAAYPSTAQALPKLLRVFLRPIPQDVTPNSRLDHKHLFFNRKSSAYHLANHHYWPTISCLPQLCPTVAYLASCFAHHGMQSWPRSSSGILETSGDSSDG